MLTFVGTLSYGPNRRAVIRICEGLAARLIEVDELTEVRLVGSGVGDLRDVVMKAPVTLRGFVDNLDSELDAADVMIIPVESGSGTRIKAIDALSRGVPIISTEKGVEGLGLEDGLTYLRAESDADFAEAWRRLRSDWPRGARRLAASALSQYHSRLSPEAMRGEIFEAAREAERRFGQRADAKPDQRPTSG